MKVTLIVCGFNICVVW